MVAVTAPPTSTLMRQESIQVVVVFFGLSSGSNVELPPLGSRQAAMPMPASRPCGAQAVALGDQPGVVGARQHLVDHGVVVAAVVGGAARDQVGKLLGGGSGCAAAPRAGRGRDARRPRRSRARWRSWSATGRRRAPPPARSCWWSPRWRGTARCRCGTARRWRRSACRAGTASVPHRRRHCRARASSSSGRRRHRRRRPRRRNALGPVRVAAAHVLEPVLDQPHRDAEPARQIADQHRVLDAALDAVAAADVDVVVHAHRRARQLQRARDLVGNISASGSRPRRRGSRARGPSSPARRRSRSAPWSCAPT